MQKMSIKRIICMLLTITLLLAQFSTIAVCAETVTEPEVVNYEWSDDTKTQLDMHNAAQTIPLVDLANLFGWTSPLDMVIRVSKDGEVIFSLTDVITDLKQIFTGGLSLEALAEIGISLEADAHYTIEKGKVDIKLGWPPSYTISWSDGPSFTTKIFDNLTVTSNKSGLVVVNGNTVTDSSTVKIYRGATPSVVVGMGDLSNFTVSATVGDDVVLTEAGTYTFANGLSADTDISVIYVEDTESTIALGAVTGFESVEFPATADAESEVNVKITPNDGYYVHSIAIKNGDSEVEVVGEYLNGVWIGTFKAAESKTHYTIDCETKQVVVLNGNTIAYNEMMEMGDIHKSIYDRIDQSNSAPLFADINGLVFEYNAANIGDADWKPLNYIPEGLSMIAHHAFGLNDKEKIRISYVGNGKQYRDGSVEFTATLSDDRNTNAAIDVHETAVVTYGSFTNEDILAKLLDGRHGAYDMQTNVLIADAELYLNRDLSKLPVGEYNVTVMFDGNAIYAECEKNVKITIIAAPADINVTSKHIKPTQDVTINSMISINPANAGHISFVLGLDAVEGASVMKIDVSNMLHIPETLRPAVDVVLSKIDNKTVTVDELEHVLTQVGALDAQLDLTYIKRVIVVLKEIESLEGIGQLQLSISTDGKIDTNNVGAYLVGSMISDVNYEFDAEFGYLVITPELTKVTLAFNNEINPIVTFEEIANCIYDMGAHVIEQEYAEANDKLVNVFCGLTDSGKVYVSNEAPAVIGAYAQIAYINDLGNVMYYATPIARAYTIAPDLAKVMFVDEVGNVVDMYDFVYDGDTKMATAIAVHKNGTALDSAKLTYKYVGVCTDATLYESVDAPSKSGVYTVMALYKDADKEVYGAAFAPLIIEQSDSQFSAIDVEVVVDGSEKFINIVNPNALDYLSVIVNGKNINILVPETWGIDTTNIPVEDIVNEIFDLIAQIPKIPEVPEVQEAVTKLSEILNDIKNYQVAVNDAKPSEVGAYEIFALAFGANHKITLVEAILTITEVEEEPTDPSEPIDPEEPDNTCKCCDACTGAEGCECFCGECNFCEKEPENTCDCCDKCTCANGCNCECGECEFCEKPPVDPEEPTNPSEPENTCKCCDKCTGAEGCECTCVECDFCEKPTVDPEKPTDPTDPSEPEDNTTPSEPDDGNKDDVDEPKLGDDPKNNSFMFFGIIGLAVVALVVEMIVLFKNKKEQE